MKLIRELLRLQEERGFLSDDTLREVSERWRVPFYRLEGLVSFYTHFRRTLPPESTELVCRDVCCAMAPNHIRMDGEDQTLEYKPRTDSGTDETREVSCLGRCDQAPATGTETTVEGHRTTLFPHLMGVSPIGEKCDPRKSGVGPYETIKQLAHEVDRLKRTCIDRLSAAGLKGMGGAGFPTGRKWEMVAAARVNPPVVDEYALVDHQAKVARKYVICNADESEPGTFKDREILAQLPHLVIEGMVLAGLTIGAERGILFIRHEYAQERQRFEEELQRAREAGVLGDDAAGSGGAFDIEVFVSPGGYILGEETALLECLEDKRGEPRNKPPYPGQRGLWGQPTLINNVETFALATAIIHHGVEWWHEQGKDGFSGLKFVCISGDVERPGVFEIPVGTTVGELVAMAGGVRNGKTLKAFLPGGASSNFLPADKVDTPLDFDAIRAAGSMLGTGAVIVFDETRNLFPLATNLVKFFRNESCGKCVPCRIGSQRAVENLEAAEAGERTFQPSILEELNETLEQTSICGLGQVALHPVISMLKHFPNEADV
ncbi:MAG: NAD(P)H-dependent oxidoreductase subunit E [Planctomycetaceae bacterium]|nr:NAD(P)H-dependent oxidoreductase subunit E [Planctomycetaceae bacterium]